MSKDRIRRQVEKHPAASATVLSSIQKIVNVKRFASEEKLIDTADLLREMLTDDGISPEGVKLIEDVCEYLLHGLITRPEK